MNIIPSIPNNEKRDETIDYKDNTLIDHFKNNLAIRELDPEISSDFRTYIKWLNLPVTKNLVVLSSLHHYYFDEEDMKNVGILVNLKQLNQLKQISQFLHSVYNLLPVRSYFIGYFLDNRNQNGFLADSAGPLNNYAGRFDPVKYGIKSENPIINLVYNLIDLRIGRYLTKRSVTLQLEEAGLKVIDLTELNGLTFFCAQKVAMTEV